MTEDLRGAVTDAYGPSREDESRATWWARRNWYWFLIAGILAGLLALGGGVSVLVYLGIAVFALAVITGASFIVWGVARAYAAGGTRDREGRAGALRTAATECQGPRVRPDGRAVRSLLQRPSSLCCLARRSWPRFCTTRATTVIR